MKIIPHWFFQCLAAVGSFAVLGLSSAHALDLATFDVMWQGGGLYEATGLRVAVVDNLPGPGPAPTYQLFNGITLTPADAGSSFTVTAANDPDFETFKLAITNGVDDSFGYWISAVPSYAGTGHSWTEGNLFAAGTHTFGPGNFSSIGQLAGPDYAGYDITQVVLKIDTFTMSSANGYTSQDFRGTVTIVGNAVPEPASVGLLVAGALPFAWRRPRRGKA